MGWVNRATAYRQALAIADQWEKAVLGSTKTALPFAQNRRRRSGAFYTPHNLVAFATRYTLGPFLREIKRSVLMGLQAGDHTALQRAEADLIALRVLDPSCGNGRFLLAAFRHLRVMYVWLSLRERELAGDKADRNVWEVSSEKALRNLYGVDVDAAALSCAAKVLEVAAGRRGGYHLQQADITSDQGTNPLSVAPQGILGNPPWGAELLDRSVARTLGLPQSNLNIFSVFVVRCLRALPAGGRLGFVLPRNFLKGHDYACVRQELLKTAALEWIADAGKAFAGVSQEAVIVVARRLHSHETPTGTRTLVVNDQSLKASNADMIPQAFFAKRPKALITLGATGHAVRLVQRIEQAAQDHLRRYVSWGRGLEYGKSGALLRCSGCGNYTSLPRKKRAGKACSRCGRQLYADTPDYHLITPTPDAQHTHPIYAGTHVGRYTLQPPFWLDPQVPGVNYKDPQLFQGPKILIPKIAPALAAAMEEEGAYTTQGVYMLRPKGAGLEFRTLLAFINSAPVAYYYEHRYNDGAVLTTNLVLAHLLALPVPSRLTDVKMEDEAETDAAVAALYGLTASEQRVIADWTEEKGPFRRRVPS